jgi:N-acetylglutamate synthase-like GNAT family acetyltransferase
MHVRAAEKDDCQAIYKVHVKAIHELPRGSQGSEGVLEWLKTRKPSVYEQEMESETFVVVEDNGEIIGWGALSIPKAEITNVFVDPSHHRQGVGTAILTELEAVAQATGLNAVQLQATGTAIDFYLATGYRSDKPITADADWALMKKSVS